LSCFSISSATWLAVAGHGDDLAARGRHHLAAHHQQAVFVAADEALDHHVAAFGLGHREGGHHFFARGQLERHAAAVVGVRGLHDHRQADVLGGFPGFFGAVDHLAFGHRHAAAGQQRLGQFLVAGDRFADGAGVVGLGGPDALLVGAVAQLHQVAAVQAHVRNAAVGGGTTMAAVLGPR
jgi:hypothetical protein